MPCALPPLLLQAVSEQQRQENEELRAKLQQLNEAWEQVGRAGSTGRGSCSLAAMHTGLLGGRQHRTPPCTACPPAAPAVSRLSQENKQVARLQRQVQSMLAASAASPPAPGDDAQVQERLRAAEQQLAEAQAAAQQAQRELQDQCQLLAVGKLAQEQAAARAAARQQAAEARVRQLAAELDRAEAESVAQGEQLDVARQQAAAAEEEAEALRQQLAAQAAHARELEAALAGEQERSLSNAARAESAEVAQQGLGSHVKAAHTRLQQLQVGGRARVGSAHAQLAMQPSRCLTR